MKYEKELTDVFDVITVELPGSERLKVTTLENFKLGVSKLMEIIYMDGVRDGIDKAHDTVVKSINEFYQ